MSSLLSRKVLPFPKFLRLCALQLLFLCCFACAAFAGKASAYRPKPNSFTLWQLPSQTDTIGNSYVLMTPKGRLIVMDGGYASEAPYLKEFIRERGNVVEAWFLTHPHSDHIGAINEILKDPQGMRINAVYHSRFPENMIGRKDALTRALYARLDVMDPAETKVVSFEKTGGTLEIDTIKFKILGVTNPEITANVYNNSSMIIRVWDAYKSVVFLADAGEECGDKVLSLHKKDLDCDYLQVSHHGQAGCSESFYKSVKFRFCLWPTPTWVWDPKEARLTTLDTRRWMDEIGIKRHYVSGRDGLVVIK